MKLILANSKQHMIASLLWEANTTDEVNAIIEEYGHDALVVRDLMIATAFDEIEDTDLADEVIKNIKDS